MKEWWREPKNQKAVQKLLSYGITNYKDYDVHGAARLLCKLWAEDYDPQTGIDQLTEAIGHAYNKLRKDALEVKGIREL